MLSCVWKRPNQGIWAYLFWGVFETMEIKKFHIIRMSGAI